MTRKILAMVKLCIVLATVAAIRSTTPSYAADTVTYASSSGSGTVCSVSLPCGDLPTAIGVALNGAGTGIARVICLTPISTAENVGTESPGSNQTLEVNCPEGFLTSVAFLNANMTSVFRGMTFIRSSGSIVFRGSGTLILENCAFVDQEGMAIDIEPNGPLNLVIRNSRISSGSTVAIVFKPTAGGSINATFDHVTVTKNGGGGIRVDSTNGPVTLDVTDSEISNNLGNGFGVIGGTFQTMLSIHNTVISKNGQAGISASGVTAGLMIDTTLLDSNGTGATLVASGGHILTYSNNRIVGATGSGFTGSAALQ